jgi:hypothetical protein
MLGQLANDEGAITTFDFTPVATSSMMTMHSQMPDQIIAQLVAADLTARSRQIAFLVSLDVRHCSFDRGRHAPAST